MLVALMTLPTLMAQTTGVALTKKTTTLMYYAAQGDGGVADYLRKDTIGIAVSGVLYSGSDSLTIEKLAPIGWSQNQIEAFPVASYEWISDIRRTFVLTADAIDLTKGSEQTVRFVVKAQFVNWPTVETDTLTVTVYALSRELLPEKDARIAALTQSLADTIGAKNAVIAEKDAKITALVRDTIRLYNRLQMHQYDTTHVPVTVYDTTRIDTLIYRYKDTTVYVDTIYIYRDTLRLIDTVAVYVPGDTIWYPVEMPSGDTLYVDVQIPVIVYDTIYVDTVVPAMVEWVRIYVDGADVGVDVALSDSVSVTNGVVSNLEVGQAFGVYNFAGAKMLSDVAQGATYILADKLPGGVWYILVTRRNARLVATKFRL